jgi:hypothetical protein
MTGDFSLISAISNAAARLSREEFNEVREQHPFPCMSETFLVALNHKYEESRTCQSNAT